MSTPQVFSPKSWKKRDSKAIAAGISAAKRKMGDLAYDIDDAVTRIAPDKIDEFLALIKANRGKMTIKGRQIMRTGKAVRSQLLNALKKL